MAEIKDLEKYNSDMAKSLGDKTFFLNHIDTNKVNRIVDFGCADGTLLQAMPDTWYKVGVDNNGSMRAECAKRGLTCLPELNGVLPQEHTLLNMSSVIHEVYSYLTENEVKTFWAEVFSGKYEYISIRDMMVSEMALRKPDSLYGEIFWTNGKYNNDYANSFFKIWGDPYHDDEAQLDLIHYLLKYKYTDNWEREVNENYVPISVEQLKKLIPNNYEIVYEKEYILPYTKEQIKKDFNYELKDNTHIQLLLKRK